MGTGKPGRYLNTKGTGRTVSDFAVVHSMEGRLVKTQVKIKGETRFKLRLAAGGHGQAGMDMLDKYGVEYHVVKTYPNGVRVGYVPWHKSLTSKKEPVKPGSHPIGVTGTSNGLEVTLQD